jgi:hypothetical protein
MVRQVGEYRDEKEIRRKREIKGQRDKKIETEM